MAPSLRCVVGLAVLAGRPCEDTGHDDARAVIQHGAIAVTLPHPGYLSECVPAIALGPGERRVVEFECEGMFNETQFWWRDNDALADVDVRLADEETLTMGLCGAVFAISFSTPVLAGDVVSTPGTGCGRFRRYTYRIERRRPVP